MTRESAFKARVRARMAQTGESYTAARTHLDRPAVLHVTNGDSTTLTLREAGVEGEVHTWRGRLRPASEYVLWFEADLYDQLLLIEILSRLPVEPERVRLVSIGEYRGKAHFGGLGELTAAQLAALLPDAVSLTEEALALGRQAWLAYRAPAPDGLPAVARAQSPELRFLGEAFGRLMQEYPWRGDGLSLSERRILQAVAEGAGDRGTVFREVWRRERRPFWGDEPLFALLDSLGTLVSGSPLRLTEAGREVLEGRADHVQRHGIDRWIGGVHLTGAPDWRYDERLEAIAVP